MSRYGMAVAATAMEPVFINVRRVNWVILDVGASESAAQVAHSLLEPTAEGAGGSYPLHAKNA